DFPVLPFARANSVWKNNSRVIGTSETCKFLMLEASQDGLMVSLSSNYDMTIDARGETVVGVIETDVDGGETVPKLKLLEDLKELAEYDQSTRTDRPIFLNDNEDHPVQNKESPENSSEENVVSKTNQEPPQDSDIHQLIEECSVEDDIDNLIESALDSKLLSINLINSQRLDKKEQEVKNVVEQPDERRNRAKKSLQNFRVIHKSSIFFKNTSQISSIHSIAHIQSTKEPEHLLSMGYKHLSITPKTESDKVKESNAENLVPITSKCEVTSEDVIECDKPAKDESSSIFMTFSNLLFDYNDDFASSDDESLPNEDVPEEIRLIENLLYDNSFPRPLEELNAEIADTIVESIPLLPIPVQDGNSQQEEIDIVTKTDDVLPPSDDNDDDSLDDLLLGEADLFLSDNSISPGIENVVVDPEGDVRFLDELLIDDSILSHESFDSNFEDSPLIPRPPLEPPDIESFFDLNPDVIAKEISDKLNEDKCLNQEERLMFLQTIKMIIPRRLKLSCDGYFPGFQDLQIPSGKIKVHIEVLSVLWGNRLPIRTVRCRCLGC
nr:hypothetical protein [Tanacetum cinerariifolium]